MATPLWTPDGLAQFGHNLGEIPTAASYAPYFLSLMEDGKYPGGTVAGRGDGLYVIPQGQEEAVRRVETFVDKASEPIVELLRHERLQ